MSEKQYPGEATPRYQKDDVVEVLATSSWRAGWMGRVTDSGPRAATVEFFADRERAIYRHDELRFVDPDRHVMADTELVAADPMLSPRTSEVPPHRRAPGHDYQPGVGWVNGQVGPSTEARMQASGSDSGGRSFPASSDGNHAPARGPEEAGILQRPNEARPAETMSLSNAIEEMLAQSIDDYDVCRICHGKDGGGKGHESNCSVVLLTAARESQRTEPAVLPACRVCPNGPCGPQCIADEPASSDVEFDSPNFVPKELEELKARNYERINNPRRERAEPVVWADEASPFTGPQVLALLRENEALRKVEKAAREITRWDWSHHLDDSSGGNDAWEDRNKLDQALHLLDEARKKKAAPPQTTIAPGSGEEGNGR